MSVEVIAFICLAGIGILVGGYLYTVRQFRKMSKHPEDYVKSEDPDRIHLNENG